MRIEWNKLSPRERDALVAEKVMGWTREDCTERWVDNSGEEMALVYSEYFNHGWSPTTDHNAAAEVKNQFRWFQLEKWPTHYICFAALHGQPQSERKVATANTEPEAICIAALRAKGIEVEV